MKTTIRVLVLAVVLGLVLGGVMGWLENRRYRWDPSMETPDMIARQRDEADKALVTEAKKIASGEVKAPKVYQPEIEFDFGVLEKNEQNEKGEHRFVIENRGTEVLKLTEKDKSCFCTNFKVEKKSVAPGEKSTVLVTWDGHRGGGSFKQSVLVGTNDPLKPEIFFNVKGLYTSPVVASPNLLSFKGISSTKENSRDFHLLGFGKTEKGETIPLEITKTIVPDPDHYSVTLEKAPLDQMTEDEKKNEVFGKATSLYIGKLTLQPGLPQGAFQEVLQFHTNNTELPILEMMIEGQVSGTVTISGAKYDKHGTGQLRIGPVSTRETTLEKMRLMVIDPSLLADKSTVRVLRKRPDWLGVEIILPSDEAQQKMPVKLIDVNVTIPAGSPQGKFTGPDLADTGEIVFGIGAGEKPQEVILPVNFAVGP